MVIKALDDLENALKKPGKLDIIGGMAVEMIRSKIHKGDGFEPLSPATAAYRGAGRPLQDTSGLRDSITFKEIDDRTVSIGTNKPYAAIQHNGGVIRAKNKKWLTIPAADTRDWQRKYGYKTSDLIQNMRAAGYKVFIPKDKRIIVWQEKRRSRNAEGKLEYKLHILFYLKKSVEIPARPFFYLNDHDMDLLMKEAGSALEQL